MNDLTTTSGSGDTMAGLPIPPKEKMARWAAHLAVLALGVTGVITFMPYINKALTLLVNGVWSLTELGLAATCAFGLTFAIIKFTPAVKMLIESWASKALWSVIDYDPVTPLELWLKEVRQERITVQDEYQNCEGAISTNEQMIADNLKRAEKGDKLFAVAVKQYGEDSSEARLQALEPGRLRETVENVKERLEPLKAMRDILKEVVDATVYTERAAESEVEGLKQELSIAKINQRATDAAERVINGRSERRQIALKAQKVIHDKYATSFGRLRGFRENARELISSVNLQQGAYHQEALERLKAESRLITGGRKPELLEAKPVGQEGGVSYYTVPAEKARASRK